MLPLAYPMTSSLLDSILRVRSSASGGNASMSRACLDSKSKLVAVPRRVFPPSVVVEVKALACELPTLHGKPLSRFSMAELRRAVIERGLVAEISGATLWRWLDHDAIRPWRYRSWIFPRDPKFSEKAGRVLDLYEGRWEKNPLGPKDFVLSADEKTSIQARLRCHPSLPPAPDRPLLVEHEYERGGALAYIAAWDVRRAKIFGRCEPTTGIAPFDRLIEEVMAQEPYRSARRVFWVVDNGSSLGAEHPVRRRRFAPEPRVAASLQRLPWAGRALSTSVQNYGDVFEDWRPRRVETHPLGKRRGGT